MIDMNQALKSCPPPTAIYLGQAPSGPILWRMGSYPSWEAQRTLPLTPAELLHERWMIQILREGQEKSVANTVPDNSAHNRPPESYLKTTKKFLRTDRGKRAEK